MIQVLHFSIALLVLSCALSTCNRNKNDNKMSRFYITQDMNLQQKIGRNQIFV